MQLKLDFLCRDSILAAPIVLDLALLLDLAQRSDAHGVQEWMSFFFKAPTTPPGSRTVHDLFQQRDAVYAQLRRFAGVE
jgi:myo-inositol-1-phosphate synthase